MSNSFPSPGQILAPTPTSAPAVAGSGNSGFLGNDGFLSKFGETALDVAGLFGRAEIEKARLEAQAAADRRNPSIEASQRRAGIFQVPQVVTDNKTPLLIMGGIALVGVAVAVTIAANQK